VALPRDLIALHRTLNRETAAHAALFADHRARVTSLVLDAAGSLPSPTLALLGAGNCNDVDLGALARRFGEVHLVDVDREAVERARDGEPRAVQERLRLHAPVDLGGGLARLPALKKKREVTPVDLGALPGSVTAEALGALPVRADLVVSSCLLSQIVHTCDRVLGGEHPQLEAVACALVVAHVRTLVQLARPGGTALLITDAATSHRYPLEELWGTRTPAAMLEEIETAGSQLSGTGPVFLRRILRTDPVVGPLVGPPRSVEPWLWRLNPDLTLLVHALAIPRRGD
jgi:hypothetical protein